MGHRPFTRSLRNGKRRNKTSSTSSNSSTTSNNSTTSNGTQDRMELRSGTLKRDRSHTPDSPAKRRNIQFYNEKAQRSKASQNALVQLYNETSLDPRQRRSKRVAKEVKKFITLAGKKCEWRTDVVSDKARWIHAIKMLQKRKDITMDELVPNERQLGQIADQAFRKMAEFTSFLRFGKEKYRTGNAILRKLRAECPKTGPEAEKAYERIRKIIAGARNKHIHKAGNRIEIVTGDNQILYADKSLIRKLDKIRRGTLYKTIVENEVNLKKFDKEFRDNAEALKEKENNLHCDCENGECNDKCPCHQLQQIMFQKASTESKKGMYYSCSSRCKCSGTCSQSFPPGPKNAVETFIHPEIEKGAADRSNMFFLPGDSVSPFFGEIGPWSSSKLHDEYALSYFCKENHELLKECLEKAVKRFHKENNFEMDKDYEQMIKKAMNVDYYLDPSRIGTQGRYMASSCLGNLKLNHVHKNGFNPSNIELIFSALMPIYPTMELTFFYSIQYIVEKLKDTCLCGELCCIRNQDIWPYITKDHVKEYYRNVYDEASKTMRKYASEANDQRIQ